jgi:lipopolysaccharide export system permease protein
MPLIERYIFGRAARVFLLTLCALTGVFWVTLVLRELDVVTAKGQAIWVFLLMTFLGLPALIQIVAPIALLVAIITTLNSLTNESELPIISAAGASHKAINRPIIVLGVVVMLAVAFSHHVLAPASLSAFRTLLARVRADVIATLVQDGGFRALENGLTMHFRQRTADGSFRGVFINDERDAQEPRTFSAARGVLLEHAGGPFLVLQDGDVIREDRENREGSVVTFETYAIDLSRFEPPSAAPIYEAMERSTLFLLDPPQSDSYSERYPLRVRAEIHDRATGPFYAFVFALIALGFLGRPRTNRQDRSLAIVSVVLLCIMFRSGGFAAMGVGRKVSAAIPFMYAVPLAGLAFGIYANLHDTRSWVTPRMEVLGDRIARASKRMLTRDPTPAGMGDGR